VVGEHDVFESDVKRRVVTRLLSLRQYPLLVQARSESADAVLLGCDVCLIDDTVCYIGWTTKRIAKGAVMGVIMAAVQRARVMSNIRAGVVLLTVGSPKTKLTIAVSEMNTQSSVVSLCVCVCVS
jgi:hypothetical protein